MSDLFSSLNRKSARKIRTVQPKKVISKPDTTHLEKISTEHVDTIISNTRRIKENEIQEWINQTDPGPFDILKRISEISLPHHNLLSKIIPELEEILSKPQPPTEINTSRSKKHFLSSSSSASSMNSQKVDSNEDSQIKIFNANSNFNLNPDTANFYNIPNLKNNENLFIDYEEEQVDIQKLLDYDPYANSYAISNSHQMKAKLSSILIESHDCHISIMDKKEKIKELKKLLEQKKEEKNKLQLEFKDLQYLLNHEKFGNYEVLKKEKEEEEEFKNLDKNEKRRLKRQEQYSQIYGESRRLRDDIHKLTNDLNENHKFQLSFAHENALKQIEEKNKLKEEEEEQKE